MVSGSAAQRFNFRLHQISVFKSTVGFRHKIKFFRVKKRPCFDLKTPGFVANNLTRKCFVSTNMADSRFCWLKPEVSGGLEQVLDSGLSFGIQLY